MITSADPALLVIDAPSSTILTLPSASLFTTTWPLLSAPLRRYVPGAVMVTVSPLMVTPSLELLFDAPSASVIVVASLAS